MNLYAQIQKNRRATWVMISSFVFFFLIVGFGFDYYAGLGYNAPIFTILAVLMGLVLSYSGYRYGDKLVLSSTHAKPLDLTNIKESQWNNVVDEMAIAAGIPAPKAYIIDDPDPNAFATGRDPKRASIAITRGLLDALDRDELQAVAAHEMSHIKNYDTRLMLMVAVLVGAITLLADWTARSLYRGGRRDSRSDSRGGQNPVMLALLAIWIVTVVLSPILSRMMAMCVSRKREYLADASGAELTRNPVALARALEKIDSKNEPTRSINRGTAHLCITDPTGSSLNSREGWFADLLATHPPLAKRVEALKSMAYVG